MNMEKNLLFGVLALQSDLINPEQFAEACMLWSARKTSPLGEILEERGWIRGEDRAVVERLLELRLARHQGNASECLAATMDHQARSALAGVTDQDIARSVSSVSGNGDPVLLTTMASQGEKQSRYSYTRLHGEGGLGRVWLARDEDLKRQVAIKEIQPAHADHQDAWERFFKEAQITGQLEHPNIVPVYELGRHTEHGRPFYAMRFVRGQTLSQAIQEYHGRRAAGRADPLELPRLLQSFVAVCNAIGYAHSRGVIHRDLKPSNVVLGGFGEVIVLDWGLAKLVDAVEPDVGGVSLAASASDSQTMAGRVLGTPAFMAPEQAEGRVDLIDARTDIYGLGAILYAILTGKQPHEGKSTADLLQQIIHGETPRPRELDRSVPPALDAVARKSMAKRREDRYAQAAELAGDVERWLHDEPVSVFRDPWLARVGRWSRRHKAKVAGAAALLIAAVIGLTISNALIAREQAKTEAERVRADDARIEAEANAERARQLQQIADNERQRAESNFQRARDAVDKMLSRVGDVRLRNVPLMENLRQELLEEALAFNRQFLEQDAEDFSVRQEALRAHRRLGDINGLLQNNVAAEEDYRKAIAIGERLVAESPTRPEASVELASSHDALAVLMIKLGKYDAAEESFKTCLGLWNKVLSDNAATDGWRADRARVLLRLAQLHAATGRHEQAEAGLRDAVQQFEALVAERDVPEFRNVLTDALKMLADQLIATNRLEEGEQLARRALEHRRSLVAAHPHVALYRENLRGDLDTLARLMLRTGRTADAEIIYTELIEVTQQLAEDFPSIPDHRLNVAAGHSDLGILKVRSGRTSEAETAFRTALTILEQLADDVPSVPEYRRRLGSLYNNLANIIQAQGRLAEAIESHLKAIPIRKQLVEDYPNFTEYRQELGMTLNNLGAAHTLKGDYPAAADFYAQANQVRELLVAEFPAVPAYRYSLSLGYMNAGIISLNTNELEAAANSLEKSIALLTKLVEEAPSIGEYAASLVDSRNLYSELLLARGDATKALEILDQALLIHERLMRDFPKMLDYRRNKAICHHKRAELLDLAGEAKAAEAEVELAIQLSADLVAESAKNRSYNEVLANAYQQKAHLLVDESRGGNGSRLDQAATASRRAIDLIEPLVAESPKSERARNILASALVAAAKSDVLAGQQEGGRALLTRARELQQGLVHDFPGVVSHASALAETLGELAKLAWEAGEEAQARQLFEDALARHQVAIEAQPHNVAFQQRGETLEELRKRFDESKSER